MAGGAEKLSVSNRMLHRDMLHTFPRSGPPPGTPIPAAGAGRVVARGYNRGHGNFVRIRHNGSFETLYAHMSKFAKNVKVGTTVKQGQIIGYSGSTGLSTGPHLHYEVRTCKGFDCTLNPLSFY